MVEKYSRKKFFLALSNTCSSWGFRRTAQSPERSTFLSKRVCFLTQIEVACFLKSIAVKIVIYIITRLFELTS